MPSSSSPAADARSNGIGREPVLRATGRDHEAWFALLDEAGAATWAHRDIASHLMETHAVDGWWAQHLTVAYEQARGLRAKHQRPDGFAVSRSRTVAAPADVVYAAIVEDRSRARWLDGDLAITSTQVDRSINGRWDGGPERLAIGLVAKDEAKTQVAVQHLRLPDADAAEAAKTAWGNRLARLADLLDRGTG